MIGNTQRSMMWGMILYLTVHLFSVSNGHDNTLTLSGCLQGSSCSQCPKSQYTLDPEGQMLCCPGCSSALLYYGKHPSNWCVCYTEASNSVQSGAQPKTLKFPGSSTITRYPSSSSSSTGGIPSSNFLFGSNTKPTYGGGGGTDGTLRDALYVIGQENTHSSTSGFAHAVNQAITLMANTIESLNTRITYLETIIIQHFNGQTIDRVGSASPANTVSDTPPPSQTGGAPCKDGNFTRVGAHCYYVSVWHNQRAIWEKASKSCEGMGAKLAEPLNAVEFRDLTQYLSLETTTTGYSYWIGGLYLGTPWLWAYSGTQVNLDAVYWTEVDTEGNRVTPGDTSTGRCLSFHYHIPVKNYYYFADQCGYEKYYVCQYLEKSHRRF